MPTASRLYLTTFSLPFSPIPTMRDWPCLWKRTSRWHGNREQKAGARQLSDISGDTVNTKRTGQIAVWLALVAIYLGENIAQAEPQKPDEGWQLEGNATERYERILVPAIFDPWATDLLIRIPPAAGERVLDVACGTGIVARRAARLVGPGGKVAGLDYSPAMIAVAQTREDGAGIEWRQGDAHALPFAAASFDVV